MAEEQICSEITGTVWKIEMGIGDKVEEDDVIMILESMKMEIPVLAPCAGTLQKLLVEEGSAIAEGQMIAIVDT
ncbi:biotin/lipoyl-binding carrier protein [Lutimaribacter sp. EGI FJ00015]|uniref:Biotin/lipoyl-binding carrier protein n=1 Tax=Lutimaribacter degradans TaxID=2945989 RepID=A0ACC5ZU58_9RHOB|nr:biotin/lipoyl-binding carrier protein [Lutimaribacter sp. EGI FJ00013]MCM2561660.1 biotin/lipoyl-binding carrier protein [Lutimaribacter sp. EGI FJ00013]MCO0612628.1 biotin/lipoyl-binding carrier protein [Lutimaribacter sp. EGI FJ00015]MCO0635286.1 biotin/lipoyl-binding carrier protein [Lutimaribacter sp. EGI FJ00014]